MERHQLIAFIYGDCEKLLTKEDNQELSLKFEKFQILNLNTFKTIIHFDPLYKIIRSSYRIPDQYNFNKRKEEIEKLENYIPETTIETLSYFEYVGEKIYSCKKQGEGYWGADFDSSSSSDIHSLMTGLEKYLINNVFSENHDLISEEVKNLKIMSEIGQKYNLELKFLDGYHWQR